MDWKIFEVKYEGKERAISWAKISVSDISITNQDNADIYMRR